MKRWAILAILFACVSGVISLAEAQQKGKVLIILREGESQNLEMLLKNEVTVMRDKIEQAGFETVVASVSGEPFAAEKTTITPDLKLDDVNVDDYAGVMVPCLAVDSPPAPEAIAIIKKAVAEGKPVAAQRGSVPTLAEAGVLTGKKYAHAAEPSTDESPAFKGAVFVGTGVVQDGNVITSGICPLAAVALNLEDGTEELTRRFIDSLNRGK